MPDHAIEDGTIPAVHIGRRVLIPRRPFLRAFGVDDEAPGMTARRKPSTARRAARERGTGSITSYRTKSGLR